MSRAGARAERERKRLGLPRPEPRPRSVRVRCDRCRHVSIDGMEGTVSVDGGDLHAGCPRCGHSTGVYADRVRP